MGYMVVVRTKDKFKIVSMFKLPRRLNLKIPNTGKQT